MPIAAAAAAPSQPPARFVLHPVDLLAQAREADALAAKQASAAARATKAAAATAAGGSTSVPLALLADDDDADMLDAAATSWGKRPVLRASAQHPLAALQSVEDVSARRGVLVLRPASLAELHALARVEFDWADDEEEEGGAEAGGEAGSSGPSTLLVLLQEGIKSGAHSRPAQAAQSWGGAVETEAAYKLLRDGDVLEIVRLPRPPTPSRKPTHSNGAHGRARAGADTASAAATGATNKRKHDSINGEHEAGAAAVAAQSHIVSPVAVAPMDVSPVAAAAPAPSASAGELSPPRAASRSLDSSFQSPGMPPLETVFGQVVSYPRQQPSPVPNAQKESVGRVDEGRAADKSLTSAASPRITSSPSSPPLPSVASSAAASTAAALSAFDGLPSYWRALVCTAFMKGGREPPVTCSPSMPAVSQALRTLALQWQQPHFRRAMAQHPLMHKEAQRNGSEVSGAQTTAGAGVGSPASRSSTPPTRGRLSTVDQPGAPHMLPGAALPISTAAAARTTPRSAPIVAAAAPPSVVSAILPPSALPSASAPPTSTSAPSSVSAVPAPVPAPAPAAAATTTAPQPPTQVAAPTAAAAASPPAIAPSVSAAPTSASAPAPVPATAAPSPPSTSSSSPSLLHIRSFSSSGAPLLDDLVSIKMKVGRSMKKYMAAYAQYKKVDVASLTFKRPPLPDHTQYDEEKLKTDVSIYSMPLGEADTPASMGWDDKPKYISVTHR